MVAEKVMPEPCGRCAHCWEAAGTCTVRVMPGEFPASARRGCQDFSPRGEARDGRER